MSEKARKVLRLPAWDYTSPGAYFVTICCHQKQLLFEDERLSETARRCWEAIPEHFPAVELDAFVVMPNHVHGVIWIRTPRAVVAQHAEPLRPEVSDKPEMPERRGMQPGSLGAIVRSFKAAVTRDARVLRLLNTDSPLWQRNYYERVVRDDDELNRIREYIALNPARWASDGENPGRVLDAEYERDWHWLEDGMVVP